MIERKTKIDLAIIIIALLVCRFLFIALMPQVFSVDMISWTIVGELLSRGINPYNNTSMLNWPPLWMQIIFLVQKTSEFSNIPFPKIIQALLIFTELSAAIILYLAIKRFFPSANACRDVLIGISLNPVAILLVCQHCNFDVIVSLWIILFFVMLFYFWEKNTPEYWLCACLFLGLGVLTKTIPLILFPLLLYCIRPINNLYRIIGAYLFIFPCFLGMSILFTLGPGQIFASVISYRSKAGDFGFTSLLYDVPNALPVYNMLFLVFVLFILAKSSIYFSKQKKLASEHLLLFGTLLLMIIPTFGPGYATQYIYWYIPLLIMSYSLFDRKWKLLLTTFYCISVVTYIVEYGFIISYGASFAELLESKGIDITKLCEYLESAQSIIRIPIFLAYITIISKGFLLLRRTS